MATATTGHYADPAVLEAVMEVNTPRATQNGHCQACGRSTAITKGYVAKHGYTTAHGFFEGTCMGSGELPLELARNVIGRSIDMARQCAETNDRMVEELQGDATSTECWAEIYNKRAGKMQLTRGEVVFSDDKDGGLVMQFAVTGWLGEVTYHGFFASGMEGLALRAYRFVTDQDGAHKHMLTEYERSVECLKAATVLNHRRAAGIARKAAQLREYAAAQEKAYDRWMAQPSMLVARR